MLVTVGWRLEMCRSTLPGSLPTALRISVKSSPANDLAMKSANTGCGSNATILAPSDRSVRLRLPACAPTSKTSAPGPTRPA